MQNSDKNSGAFTQFQLVSAELKALTRRPLVALLAQGYVSSVLICAVVGSVSSLPRLLHALLFTLVLCSAGLLFYTTTETLAANGRLNGTYSGPVRITLAICHLLIVTVFVIFYAVTMHNA